MSQQPPKGVTTQSLGTEERPRLAENPVPPVAPMSRISVHQQELIELEGLDPDTLDPDRHYRLVSTRDARVMRKRVRQGYEIETLRKGGPRPLIDPESSDGTIRFGDRVLMSCPKKLFLERRERNFRFSESRLSNVQTVKAFKEKAAERGVTVLDQRKTSATEEQEIQ